MSRLSVIIGGVIFVAAAAGFALDIGGIRSGMSDETRISAASVGAGDAAPAASSEETQIAQADTNSGAATPVNAEMPDTSALADKGYALGDIVIGDENAPLTMYEYASLTCPHCASFHNDVLPELKKAYVDTGKVKLVVREVYFDQFGLYATAVARCGGVAPYERFLNVFFKRQRDWSRGANEDAILTEIRRIGRQGGLPAERVDACLADEEFLSTLFEQAKVNITADQIEATPTFVIGDEKVRGARSIEEMSKLIDGLLAAQ